MENCKSTGKGLKQYRRGRFWWCKEEGKDFKCLIDASRTVREEAREVIGFWVLSEFQRAEIKKCGIGLRWSEGEAAQAGSCVVGRDALCQTVIFLNNRQSTWDRREDAIYTWMTGEKAH